MRVKGTVPEMNQENPNRTGEGDTHYWKGEAHSLADFLVIREVIRELWQFLETCPNAAGVKKEEYFLFALKRLQFLKAKLVPISMEAFLETAHLTAHILKFRECLDEEPAKGAKASLKKIHELLSLDKI